MRTSDITKYGGKRGKIKKKKLQYNTTHMKKNPNVTKI